MSSTSGLGGGGASQMVVEGGQLEIGGTTYDLTTDAGTSAAQQFLSADQLAELEGLMAAQGYKLSGSRWVPNDARVSQAELAMREEQRIAQGLSNTQAREDGMTELDDAVVGAFEDAGVPNPYNANTTPQYFSQIEASESFNTAVQAAGVLLTGSADGLAPDGTIAANRTISDAGVEDFAGRIRALMIEFPNGNVMEALFLVFRESIRQTNEDKKYFLIKLQEYNKMAESLSDYLSELVEESQRLSGEAAGAKYPEKVTISIQTKKFDVSTLGADGNVKLAAGYPQSKTVDRAGLNDTIKDVESQQETIRNQRQMASTAFQNFDQKSNQLFNLMSSVLKVMNEMRMGTTRNML